MTVQGVAKSQTGLSTRHRLVVLTAAEADLSDWISLLKHRIGRFGIVQEVLKRYSYSSKGR